MSVLLILAARTPLYAHLILRRARSLDSRAPRNKFGGSRRTVSGTLAAKLQADPVRER